MISRSTLPFVLLPCLCALLILSACDKKSASLPPNQRPGVSVTGGPPQGGVGSYTVTISWTGWDNDGFIDHFLYAIDDTTEWAETIASQRRFMFEADSLREGEEFGRWHTFWIKAVDDLHAQSIPAYLTFDSRTIAPSTRILYPVLCYNNGSCPG